MDRRDFLLTAAMAIVSSPFPAEPETPVQVTFEPGMGPSSTCFSFDDLEWWRKGWGIKAERVGADFDIDVEG